MRFSLLAPVLLAAFICSAGAALAGVDAVAECENFFKKFQACVDGLEGEQKDEAKIFLKTLRGTLGMADGINRGDPTLTGMMCGTLMEESKKDPDIQKYKCKW